MTAFVLEGFDGRVPRSDAQPMRLSPLGLSQLRELDEVPWKEVHPVHLAVTCQWL